MDRKLWHSTAQHRSHIYYSLYYVTFHDLGACVALRAKANLSAKHSSIISRTNILAMNYTDIGDRSWRGPKRLAQHRPIIIIV